MTIINQTLDYYPEFFPTPENQFEFIERLVGPLQQPVKILNIEAGAGVLAEKLAEKYEVIATDRYTSFTNLINKRKSFSTNKLNVFNIEPIDIGRYFGKQFVDLIFCLDSRVIFMKDLTLIKKFLFDSKMILKENGYVVIEVVNFAKLNFEEDSIQMPTRESCRGSLFTTIIKDKKTATYRLFQNIVTTNDTVIEKVKNEEVWPISKDTFTSISNELGFSSVNFFSDFNGASYSEDTDNLICVFKK